MGVKADDTGVYALDFDHALVCLSPELERIWRQDWPAGFHAQYEPYYGPHLWEDVLVVHHGVNEAEGRVILVRGYDKASGALRWEYRYAHGRPGAAPRCCTLAEGLFCFTTGERVHVLDARTGAVLVDAEIGHEMGSLIYPYQGHLLALCDFESAIRVFSRDGRERVQTLAIPEPYRPVIKHGLVVHGDRLYLQADNASLDMATTGWLCIAPSLAGEPEAVLDPRPPSSSLQVTLPDGETLYCVIIAAADYDTLERYARIELHELASLTCKEGPKRDKYHKGRMELRLPRAAVPAKREQELRDMLADAERFMDIFYTPGSGKKYSKQKKYHIELVFMD